MTNYKHNHGWHLLSVYYCQALFWRFFNNHLFETSKTYEVGTIIILTWWKKNLKGLKKKIFPKVTQPVRDEMRTLGSRLQSLDS